MRQFVVLLLTLVLLSTVTFTFGANYYWVGGSPNGQSLLGLGVGNLLNPKWKSGDSLLTALVSLILPSVNDVMHIDVGASGAFSLTGALGAVVLESGIVTITGDATFNGLSTISAGAIVNIGAGANLKAGSFNIGGNVTLGGGSISTAGTFEIADNGFLDITAASTISGTQVSLKGAASVSGATQLTLNSNAKIVGEVGSAFSIGGNAAVTGSGTIQTSGSLFIDAGLAGLATISANVVANHTSITSGDVQFDGSVQLPQGSLGFQIAAGSVAKFSGQVTIDNDVAFSGNGNVSFSATSTVAFNKAASISAFLHTDGQVQIQGSGATALTAEASFGQQSKLSILSGAQLQLHGDVVFSSDNAIEGDGDLSIEATGMLDIQTAANIKSGFIASGMARLNTGKTRFGGSVSLKAGGLIDIQAGATAEFDSIVDLSEDGDFFSGSGSVALTAASSLHANADVGFSAPVSASGLLSINAGRATFKAGVELKNNSNFTVAANANADFHGSLSLKSALGLRGSGQISLLAGALLTAEVDTTIETKLATAGAVSIKTGTTSFSGSVSLLSGSTGLNIDVGAAADFSSDIRIASSVAFTGSGSVNLAESASLTTETDTQIDTSLSAHGTIMIGSGTSVGKTRFSGLVTFGSAAQLQIAAGASAEFNAETSYDGTADIHGSGSLVIGSTGLLKLNSAVSLNTAVDIRGSASVKASGTTKFAGFVSLFSGSTGLEISTGSIAEFSSNISISSSVGFTGSGIVRLGATATLSTDVDSQIDTDVETDGRIVISAQASTGRARFGALVSFGSLAQLQINTGASAEFHGNATYTASADISGSGKLLIASSGLFSLKSAVSVHTDIDIQGSASIEAPGLIRFGGASNIDASASASLNIDTGATAQFDGALSVKSGSGSASLRLFKGSGILALGASGSLATSTSITVGTKFESSGTVNVNGGITLFSAPTTFKASSSLQVAASAQVDFHDQVDVVASTSWIGTGLVSLKSSARLNLNAQANVDVDIEAAAEVNANAQVAFKKQSTFSGNLKLGGLSSVSFLSQVTFNEDSTLDITAGGAIAFNGNVDYQASASIGGSGAITVGATGAFNWYNGNITTAAAGASLNVAGQFNIVSKVNADVQVRTISGRSLSVSGSLNWNTNDKLVLGAGASIANTGTINLASNVRWEKAEASVSASIQNTGTIAVAANTEVYMGVAVQNTASATLQVNAGAKLIVAANAYTATSVTAITQVQANARIEVEANAQLQLGGIIKGTGTIKASAVVATGVFAPGNSPGKLTIEGDFQVPQSGALLIEFEGSQSGQYDTIVVTGNVDIAGKLAVQCVGYVPDLEAQFTIITANAVTGSFSNSIVSGADREVLTTINTDNVVVTFKEGLANTASRTVVPPIVVVTLVALISFLFNMY
jgi:hypothetical protein